MRRRPLGDVAAAQQLLHPIRTAVKASGAEGPAARVVEAASVFQAKERRGRAGGRG